MGVVRKRAVNKDKSETDSRGGAARSRLEAAAREFASGKASRPRDVGRRWRAWLHDNFVFFAICSADGTLIAINPPALAATGLLPEEIIGRHITQVPALAHSTRATARVREILERVGRGETVRTELDLRLHGGSLARVDCLVCPLRDASGRIVEIAATAVEILVQQHEESALIRLSRELRMVSACSEVLVRARDERTLLGEICGVIVEAGRYPLAWVGFAQNDATHTIKAVARAGDDQGYLEQAQITWGDAKHGHGPTGRAFRSRQVQVSRNIQNDPSLAPWREAASRRGYRSSIALPLLAASQVLGVLTIYSDRTDAFAESEQSLLMALASDLAYGVGALRAHTERQRALDEVRDLAGQLVRAQDDVRRSVGRELHDSIGQSLAALVMNLQRFAGSGEALPPLRRELLTQCIDIAQQCVADLRTTSYLLHPPLLEERGLGSALRWLTEGFHDRSGIEVTLDVPEDLARFDRDSELALFRVAQEALTNVQRHSGSRTAHLSVTITDDVIALKIRDAGHGMRLRDELSGGGEPILGVGLAGMRERMRQLGGMLTVESGAEGTCVHASLPLKRTAATVVTG